LVVCIIVSMMHGQTIIKSINKVLVKKLAVTYVCTLCPFLFLTRKSITVFQKYKTTAIHRNVLRCNLSETVSKTERKVDNPVEV